MSVALALFVDPAFQVGSFQCFGPGEAQTPEAGGKVYLPASGRAFPRYGRQCTGESGL